MTELVKVRGTKALFQQLCKIDRLRTEGFDSFDWRAVDLAKVLLKAANIRNIHTIELPADLEKEADIARFINENLQVPLTSFDWE